MADTLFVANENTEGKDLKNPDNRLLDISDGLTDVSTCLKGISDTLQMAAILNETNDNQYGLDLYSQYAFLAWSVKQIQKEIDRIQKIMEVSTTGDISLNY